MPTHTIHVASVHARTVGRGGVSYTKYDVIIDPPYVSDGRSLIGIFETWSAFVASLCERSIVVQRPVQIVWKDSRFGKEIISCQLLNQEVA